MKKSQIIREIFGLLGEMDRYNLEEAVEACEHIAKLVTAEREKELVETNYTLALALEESEEKAIRIKKERDYFANRLLSLTNDAPEHLSALISHCREQHKTIEGATYAANAAADKLCLLQAKIDSGMKIYAFMTESGLLHHFFNYPNDELHKMGFLPATIVFDKE